MSKKKQGQEEQETMVSMKMPVNLHSAVKVIRKRYTVGDEKPKMADALMRFIAETDPTIIREAEQITALRGQLTALLGEDDD